MCVCVCVCKCERKEMGGEVSVFVHIDEIRI